MERVSQKQMVLAYMEEHGSITSMEAFDLGITRLSDVIFRLRGIGYRIETKNETRKNRYGVMTTYARYVFEQPTQEQLAI